MWAKAGKRGNGADRARKRKREGEREKRLIAHVPTWELIDELCDRDKSALHGYLRQKHGAEFEDDRNGILSATNLRVARAYRPKPSDTFGKFRKYYLTSIDSEIVDRWRKYGSRFSRCDDEKLLR